MDSAKREVPCLAYATLQSKMKVDHKKGRGPCSVVQLKSKTKALYCLRIKHLLVDEPAR